MKNIRIPVALRGHSMASKENHAVTFRDPPRVTMRIMTQRISIYLLPSQALRRERKTKALSQREHSDDDIHDQHARGSGGYAQDGEGAGRRGKQGPRVDIDWLESKTDGTTHFRAAACHPDG